MRSIDGDNNLDYDGGRFLDAGIARLGPARGHDIGIVNDAIRSWRAPTVHEPMPSATRLFEGEVLFDGR
jgi:hypothetical protein